MFYKQLENSLNLSNTILNIPLLYSREELGSFEILFNMSPRRDDT